MRGGGLCRAPWFEPPVTRSNLQRSGWQTGPTPNCEAAALSEFPEPAGRGRKHGAKTDQSPILDTPRDPINQSCAMGDASQGATMDGILQEISAVGHRLKGMDSMMTSLTEDTRSMRLDIAGFQSRVSTLEQQVTTVEMQAMLASDRDQELLYLRSRVIDLEDRSRRDNVRFLCFPEEIEGADVQSFLKDTLPQLTGLTFDPPLEFQRAHRLGPEHREGTNHPRPIIACFLRHT
ncbi:hypothetical protein NDU88_005975 [Pleurodeles waltl]|uniref:Uncharacterized protein n=1 Tax=Pleurodeles waltl TaxID=8319 RepID=A0AAV7TYR5_PLEWA|nr:hypothetical protein NDU88_005975 [Pleurodeles waltl]